jgi:feruloyl esterase
MNRVFAAGALVVLSGLSGGLVAFGRDGRPQTPAPNRVPCASLGAIAIPASAIGLPTTGATVTAADLVPAAGERVEGARAVLATPEYCRVTGRIAPVDPTAPPINFHVNLPTSWNRKIAQMGGSGQNGVIPVALTTGMQWGPESIPPNAPYALSRGFVTFGSDSGHQNAPGGRGAAPATPPAGPPTPDWTTNDEAFTNFAYAQMKKTHDVAVALVARFYGQPIRRSYYLGSSQGGREALIVAQRFPNDYDGIFVQVPVHAYVQQSIGDPLARAKAQMGDGWIPPAKVAVIAKEVRRQCDALDGLEDGLVSAYTVCQQRFDPAKSPNAFSAVRCAGGADTGEACLSDAQIQAANTVYASTTWPFPLHGGWRTWPGWSTGSESATNWRTLQARPTPATANFGVLRSRIVKDPAANLLEVDLARYAKELQQLSATIDATDPDLSAFHRRGGKLILKVNTTDYTANPRASMAYYDKVVQTMGARAVDEFLRFYVAVGLFHNRNIGHNPITNAPVPMYVDFIAMLDDWVEQGAAPADTQVLSDMDAVPPFTVRATFPMCRYPMYPRYNGSGDTKSATSYTCTRP